MYISLPQSREEAIIKGIALLLIWAFFGLIWLFQYVRSLLTGYKDYLEIPKVIFLVLTVVIITGIVLGLIAAKIYQLFGG